MGRPGKGISAEPQRDLAVHLGAENAGAVTLSERGNITEMRVVIDYDPTWLEAAGDAVTGTLSRSVSKTSSASSVWPRDRTPTSQMAAPSPAPDSTAHSL